MDAAIRESDILIKNLTYRLEEAYIQAYRTSIEDNKRAIEKLSKLRDEIDDPTGRYANLSDEAKDLKVKAFVKEVERTEKVSNRIGSELARAGEFAAKMIQQEMPNIWALNYNQTEKNISDQTELGLSFTQFDRNQIAAIIDEWQSPFTKIAYKDLGKNEDIIRRLQNEFLQGTVLGESQQQLMRRIKKIADMKTYQAKRIAQTERNRIQSQGRMMGFREAEAMGIQLTKQWFARMINTRHSHVAVNGEVQNTNELFSNGLDYPGDPNGSAEEVINCHCYISGSVVGSTYIPLRERIGYERLDRNG